MRSCIIFIVLLVSTRIGVDAQIVATDSVAVKTELFNDSIAQKIQKLEQQIDALSAENKALEGLLEKQIAKTQDGTDEITRLKSEMAHKENAHKESLSKIESQNDQLQRNLVTMASNFLYIPYESYSINKIAIPAFKAVEGTDLYSKHKIRLELLENYFKDLSSLKTYLEKILSNKMNSKSVLRTDKGNVDTMVNELKNMEFCSRYEKYDDWKNTYFGKQLCRVMDLLKNPTDENWKKLGGIKVELDNLVNQK